MENNIAQIQCPIAMLTRKVSTYLFELFKQIGCSLHWLQPVAIIALQLHMCIEHLYKYLHYKISWLITEKNSNINNLPTAGNADTPQRNQQQTMAARRAVADAQ